MEAVIPMPRPSRHSYSSFKKFEQCKAAWKYRYMEGRPDLVGPAATRGTRVHTAGERFLKGEIPLDRLPVEYKTFNASMQLIKEMGGVSEAVWMVDRLWIPTVEESNARLKAIIDVHYFVRKELHIIDFKTGRFNRTHADQLEFYCVMAASMFPAFERVTARCFYLDENSVGNEITHRRDWLMMLRAKWEEKSKAIDTEEHFFASPSGLCKFCAYRASKGGPCQYEQKP